MKEREFELSRRSVLASIGGIGVTSAAAGLGTSAFFSDREEFRGNRLVAGELDMMVDWEEHYSDWSGDENDDWVWDIPLSAYGDPDESDEDFDNDGMDDFHVIMTEGDQTKVPKSGYVGLPFHEEPLIAVPEKFVDDFMTNTAIEAFPDDNDDGSQDIIETRNQLSNGDYTKEELEAEFRSQFGDMPAGLDSDSRTESSRGDPLIDLQDVKPGDFGEVTFSLHLFDNPGYIWLTGELVDADENGNTEPESKDDDEIGPDESDPENRTLFDTEGDENPEPLGTTEKEPVELLDEIQILVWHDDGDNILSGPNYDGEFEVLDSPHAVDRSTTIDVFWQDAIIRRGTLREILVELESGGIPLDSDPNTSTRDCFEHSTTRYLGFAWWLPVDHANELQGDSVQFDLGFYTEQCRHNDGTGNP